MRMNFFYVLFLGAALLVSQGSIVLPVHAQTNVEVCEGPYKLPDINCDGEVQVVVIGDSLVAGFNDTGALEKKGYVPRAQKKLPEITLTKYGVLGLRTPKLLSLLAEAFAKKPSPLGEELVTADIVLLDVGRNDRWYFGEPETAYKNLRKAAKKVKSKVKKLTGTSPVVVTSVLMLPNRGSQGPWVKKLNKMILDGDSKKYPADLRFDLVSKRLLSQDQIHPTPIGYGALADALVVYLKKILPKRYWKNA